MTNLKANRPSFDTWWDHALTDLSGAYSNMLQEINVGGYPPYDIVQEDEETVRIFVAVAGLNRDEIDVSVDGNTLHIKYDKRESAPSELKSAEIKNVSDISDENSSNVKKVIRREVNRILHRGIARRSFHLKFKIVEMSEISANMNNGILEVRLKRELPQSKMTKIDIQ